MPQLLKEKTMQLLHGLEESIKLYQETLSELLAAGRISQEEMTKRMADYQKSLSDGCPLVDSQPGHLGIGTPQRQEIKESFRRIEWRLRLHGGEQNTKHETDAIVGYLNYKRQQAMQQLEHSMQIARSLFHASGRIQQAKDCFLTIKAVEQLSRKSHHIQLPCWYWGQVPVHYDQRLVDEIERQTHCKATIFQRIPEGFIRISTNIHQLNGHRAVGTFIPRESKVVKTVLEGKTYRGSAFVLNNWYLAIYEPFYIDGQVEGILYVGRQEALELTPMHALSEKQVDRIFDQLRQDGAFDSGIEDDISERLIRALNNLPEHSSHPVIKMGLKEVAAMLMKEREKKEAIQMGDSSGRSLDNITRYIRENVSNDISIDFLADQASMSKASLYRYFKSRFNTSPNAFIRRERLRKAAQMLQNKDELSVQEICEEVGFKSTSYFIRIFREYYGLTPKKYQMQSGKAGRD
jgi:AraC-like DNA-binding protein